MPAITSYRQADRGVHALDAEGNVVGHVTRGDVVAWRAYRDWLKGRDENGQANVPAPRPAAPPAETSPAEIIARLTNAVQAHMDATARLRNYDNIKSAAMRAALPGSPWHAEGIAYGTWMDACWAHCYQVQADVQNGQRPVPTAAELIAELPLLELPT